MTVNSHTLRQEFWSLPFETWEDHWENPNRSGTYPDPPYAHNCFPYGTTTLHWSAAMSSSFLIWNYSDNFAKSMDFAENPGVRESENRPGVMITVESNGEHHYRITESLKEKKNDTGTARLR